MRSKKIAKLHIQSCHFVIQKRSMAFFLINAIYFLPQALTVSTQTRTVILDKITTKKPVIVFWQRPKSWKNDREDICPWLTVIVAILRQFNVQKLVYLTGRLTDYLKYMFAFPIS